MQDYLNWFSVCVLIFSFVTQISTPEAQEINIGFFFRSFENPKGRPMDNFFGLSNISPTN